MLPAVPPRSLFIESTRKLTVNMWTLSGGCGPRTSREVHDVVVGERAGDDDAHGGSPSFRSSRSLRSPPPTRRATKSEQQKASNKKRATRSHRALLRVTPGLGSQEIAVQLCDDSGADLLGAHGLALGKVGAVPEALVVHLRHHLLHPLVPLGVDPAAGARGARPWPKRRASPRRSCTPPRRHRNRCRWRRRSPRRRPSWESAARSRQAFRRCRPRRSRRPR